MVHPTNASIFPYAVFVELRIRDRYNGISVYIYCLSCSILDVHAQRNENKMAMDTLYDIHSSSIDSLRHYRQLVFFNQLLPLVASLWTCLLDRCKTIP